MRLQIRSVLFVVSLCLLAIIASNVIAQDSKPPVRAITKGPNFHWFGYYDKLQFDPTERYALGMEVDFEGRSPRPDDVIKIGMVDLKDNDKWIETIRSKCIGDKKLADVIAAKLRKKLLVGQLDLDGKGNKCPEFTAYAKHYLEDYAKIACKHNTWHGYETIIRLHLNPSWKGKMLKQINRAEVKKLLLQKQQAGLSPKTVDNIKALVSGVFTHAYEEDLIKTNPALKLGKYIKKQDRIKHIKPLSKEQVSAFLATARRETPDYYALLLFAFRTGVRLGELIGVAWEDIDFEANSIEVRRSYSHGHFSSPKSHKSRFIDMSDQLRQTLLAHRSSQVNKFGGSLPRIELSDKFKPNNVIRLVFPNRYGKPLCGDNFRKRDFKPLLEKADIPAIRFHDIRHTFASLLLQQGESLHYVKEQMGHASIQTTVDVYGHIVPGSNRNAVNKLDDEITPEIKLVSDAS